jgi:hypothetical protein
MGRQIVWKHSLSSGRLLGNSRILETAHHLHHGHMRLANFVEAAYDRAKGLPVRQVKRQAGVVIGLTIILTFPVTVVSGAGSRKHSDHTVKRSPNQWTTVQADRVAERSHASEAGPTRRR